MKAVSSIFIVVLSLIMITSCEDATIGDGGADTLPAVTSNGANTLGFKLNDKVWVPKSEGLISPLQVEFNNNSLFIKGTRGLTETFIINYKNDITKEGTYPMVFANIATDGTGYYKDVNGEEYYCDNRFGQLIIDKLDKKERIISGTFNFNVIIPGQPTSKLSITEGRFDLAY